MLTLCLPRIGINKCLRRIGFGDVLSSSIKLPASVTLSNESFLIFRSIGWTLALQTRQSHKFLLWSVGLIPLRHSPAVYHRLDFPKNHHDRQPLGTINVWWFQVSTRLRSNHSWNGSIIRFQLCRIGIVRSMLNSMQIIIAPLRKFHWRQDKLLRTWILEEHLPQKFTSKGTLQTNPGTHKMYLYTPVSKRHNCVLKCWLCYQT